MDTRQVDHDLGLSLSPWRRWLLLASMLVLGSGYIAAFAFFRTHSEDFIARQIDTQALDYACANRLSPPAELSFASGSADLALLGTGWNQADADGLWSRDADASVMLCVLAGRDLLLDLRLHSFVARRHPAVDVTLLANGTPVGQWRTRVGQNRIDEQVRLPASLAGDGRIKLTFQVDTPASPLVMRTGPDMRRLGIFVSQLKILPAPER